ncbi:MAG: ACT domain-containing protein [Gammaproteobacteria bacterium]|jgi:hypothetical protein
MSAISDIDILLRSLSPTLSVTDYVFCSVPGDSGDWLRFDPLATCKEPEGLSLVISKEAAERAGIQYDGVFRLISLGVHSSLEAVGLTAAVASKLASGGISANVIAACYHDHVLVPAHQADAALIALKQLSTD